MALTYLFFVTTTFTNVAILLIHYFSIHNKKLPDDDV